MKLRILLFCIYSFITTGVLAQLNGNYTINAAQATGGTNYQSFTDFAADLGVNGVSGNVVATVVPGSGPYNEQVTFMNIPGAGASATVTLDGSGETLTALTTSTDRHVMRLTDVQYFTVTNLHILRNPASLGGFYGIHIFNSGNHITISQCSVDISGTNSTLFGAYIASGSLTSILDSGDFHFINIINDTATGGGYGASVFGKASILATDIVISGNTFYDFHSNGVYLRETDGAVISDNYFDKRTSNVTSFNCIQIAQAANINANIFNNYITVSQTDNGTLTARGIYLFNGTGHKVYNNVIYNIQLTSGNFTGIEVRSSTTIPQIYFNTISIDNPATSSGNLYGIKEELSNTGSMLRNNLISISQPSTGYESGLVLGATSTLNSAFNSNYNLIWVPNGNVAMKNSSMPVFFAGLSDWQSVSNQDANSVSLDPQFISPVLPQPTNVSADNLGTSIAWITTDILGYSRGVPPDIGAYEFPSTTGIATFLNAGQPVCYPNPFSSTLHVGFGNRTPDGIILYNAVSGMQCYRRIGSDASIDTRDLPAGIYFYEIVEGEQSLARGKLIRQ